MPPIAPQAAARDAHAERWEIDPRASQLAFRVKHLGFAAVGGRFRAFEGEIGPDGASGTVTVASIDTGNAIRDERLRSSGFFDAARWPVITFSADGPLRSQLTGRLTICGTTRPITLTVTVEEDADELRLTARGVLSRKAMGLDWPGLREAGRLLVSDRVEMTLGIAARPV